MKEDFFNEVSLEHSVSASKMKAQYYTSIRNEYLKEIIKEVESARDIGLDMVALPKEEQEKLDFVYLKNCVFITNYGKIYINLDYLIKGYFAFLLKEKFRLENKDYLKVSPMEIQNICEFILKNIPYGPFATGDIADHEPSFYKQINLSCEIATPATIRYTKEKIISELEKVGHGTYIYRLQKEQHFNESTLKRIINVIESEIEKPIPTSLVSDETKLMEYLTLKKDLNIILERANKLIN